MILSEKGWIKASKGHIDLASELKYKEGDSGKFIIHASSADKLLLFASNGRFYSLTCDRLPSGRGFGEPVRLMIELANDHEIVGLFIYNPDIKYLIASLSGRGFITKGQDVFAQTKSGKQVLILKQEERAVAICPVEGTTVAVIGQNRKLILFPIDEVPEMSRGRGVILQRFREGGLSDIKTFDIEHGLSWKSGDKVRIETDLMAWFGKRAQAGRLPPKGFARSNKFK